MYMRLASEDASEKGKEWMQRRRSGNVARRETRSEEDKHCDCVTANLGFSAGESESESLRQAEEGGISRVADRRTVLPLP